MNPFKSRIKCEYCSKFHKIKRERKDKIVYICSTFSNLGKSKCCRNKVDYDLLIEMLSLRYGKILSDEEIIEKVKLICISEDKIEIIVNDGKPLLLTNRLGLF